MYKIISGFERYSEDTVIANDATVEDNMIRFSLDKNTILAIVIV